ncbi:unnamed protein product [Acanthoscelides obtectus]|uniref:Uncharacterized protein n=1 Tax=Acanthoscelides obtectus TaxID=200917 RepID=A0A9P0K287_ACAOB|nr:unnamed protein product [Acanthoscelides obtectus]CAK1647261.1 hypothetical protein AOBTE_LOCUS15138 [Acanthoscelides obtectus]
MLDAHVIPRQSLCGVPPFPMNSPIAPWYPMGA